MAASALRTEHLQTEQFTFGVRKCLMGRNLYHNIKVQSVVLQWHGQQPASFFATSIEKFADRWNKRLSKRRRYVEK